MNKINSFLGHHNSVLCRAREKPYLVGGEKAAVSKPSYLFMSDTTGLDFLREIEIYYFQSTAQGHQGGRGGNVHGTSAFMKGAVVSSVFWLTRENNTERRCLSLHNLDNTNWIYLRCWFVVTVDENGRF